MDYVQKAIPFFILAILLEFIFGVLSSDVNRPQTIIAMSSDTSRNKDMVLLGADIGVVKFQLADLDIWPR